jgi:hypothetical protein
LVPCPLPPTCWLVYLLAARDDLAGALLAFVALVALATAFFAGALAVAAFLVVDVLATAVLALAFAGLPGGRDAALFTAVVDFRPGPLVAAAFVALVVLAAVARPEDAFAAAVFFAADFLAFRSALKPVAGLKRMPLDAAIFTG